MKATYLIISILWAIGTQFVNAQSLPYPQSTLIKGIEIDWDTHERHAIGSDNFALTWSDDGHQYGAWGDGGGFGGENGKYRVSLGIARVEGPADNYTTHNRYGDPDNSEVAATLTGKTWGMISVEGVLYMWIHPDKPGGWGSWTHHLQEAKLYKSTDKGASWQAADWAFTPEDGLIGGNILQHGQDYTDAPDNYVYHYFVQPNMELDTAGKDSELQKPGLVHLARVPKDKIMEREAYEFFAGMKRSKPSWTKNVKKKKPAFQDKNGVGTPIGISYNLGLDRYLLTTEHENAHRGNFGLFEGQTPWGPWKTVAYFSQSEGTEFGHDYAEEVPANGFFWAFPTKWMDASGRSLIMTFTGGGRGKNNDSFNTVRVRLTQ